VRRLIVSRLVQAVPVLLLLAIANFLLLRAAPGNPAEVQAGFNASPESIAKIRVSLGLNKPLWNQLWIWLGKVIHGNLGRSYSSAESVTHALGAAAGPTVQLTLVTLALTVLIGIPLGIVAAMRHDSRPAVDAAIRTGSLVGAAVPYLVVGLLFVVIFGWWFTGILPFQGYTSILSDPITGLRYTILPALALAGAPIGIIVRLTRAGMIDVLNQEYTAAARAFGVGNWELIFRDALKNALVPVLTVLGVIFGYLLGGTVVIENIFGIPGLGRLLTNSFSQRDYPVAIGVMLVISVAFFMINLATDILYGFLNPRIRTGYATAGQ
jgi:peptide/nickel transport system permease protein